MDSTMSRSLRRFRKCQSNKLLVDLVTGRMRGSVVARATLTGAAVGGFKSGCTLPAVGECSVEEARPVLLCAAVDGGRALVVNGGEIEGK